MPPYKIPLSESTMINKNGFFLWRNGVTYRLNKGDKLYRVYGRFHTGKGIGYP